jgi:hypothetical protein
MESFFGIEFGRIFIKHFAIASVTFFLFLHSIITFLCLSILIIKLAVASYLDCVLFVPLIGVWVQKHRRFILSNLFNVKSTWIHTYVVFCRFTTMYSVEWTVVRMKVDHLDILLVNVRHFWAQYVDTWHIPIIFCYSLGHEIGLRTPGVRHTWLSSCQGWVGSFSGGWQF